MSGKHWIFVDRQLEFEGDEYQKGLAINGEGQFMIGQRHTFVEGRSRLGG